MGLFCPLAADKPCHIRGLRRPSHGRCMCLHFSPKDGEKLLSTEMTTGHQSIPSRCFDPVTGPARSRLSSHDPTKQRPSVESRTEVLIGDVFAYKPFAFYNLSREVAPLKKALAGRAPGGLYLQSGTLPVTSSRTRLAIDRWPPPAYRVRTRSPAKTEGNFFSVRGEILMTTAAAVWPRWRC